jgi:hypothetical protein
MRAMSPRHKWAGIVALTALLAGIGGAGAAASLTGSRSAFTSATKCKKKARWKCAPKTYHLSASGTYANSSYREAWSAEIDLGKRRASPGEVDYAQEGGKLTVSGSGVTEFDDQCIFAGASGPATYTVPQQTLGVPPEGINDADFGVEFHLKLRHRVGRNEYGLGVGAVQPELSNIKGTATVTCSDGTSHTEEYAYINRIQLSTAIVRPAKVGSSPLSGSAQSGGSSVTWRMAAKR